MEDTLRTVKGLFANHGGQKLIEDCLLFSDNENINNNIDSLLGNVFSRKVGLLSRLTSINEVNNFLMESFNYRIICKRIYLFYKSTTTSNEKWEIDVKSHYVRVLASLISNDTNTLQLMRQIGMEENIIPALLAMFPMPRQDCGVITAKSVTLMPFEPFSTILLGNAARCLLIYADDIKGSKIIFNIKNNSDCLFGIEKFICAMATCTDMRVRKNIAILLAKGCRLEGVRDKITELRGMQMMVELQDQL